jgi:hypothetical protein
MSFSGILGSRWTRNATEPGDLLRRKRSITKDQGFSFQLGAGLMISHEDLWKVVPKRHSGGSDPGLLGLTAPVHRNIARPEG